MTENTENVFIEAFRTGIPPHAIGVLDTDYIFDEVVLETESSAGSSFFKISRFKSITWLASNHIYDEMYKPEMSGSQIKNGFENKFEKMSEQALLKRNVSIPASKYCQTFEEKFLPHIRFVEVPEDLALEWKEQIPVRGMSDWPTVQLAALVAPAIIYTRNLKDLAVFAPNDIVPLTKAGEDVANGDALFAGGTLVVGGSGVGAIEITKRVAKALGIPPLIVGTIGIVIIICILHDSERRMKANKFINAVLEIVGPVVESTRAAKTLFRECEVLPRPNPSLTELIGQLLVRSRPLLAQEIYEKLVAGHQVPFISINEVRNALKSCPSFVHPHGERYRWQVGIRREPYRLFNG